MGPAIVIAYMPFYEFFAFLNANSEAIVAIMALIVSIRALNNNLTHNRLAMKPLLTTVTNGDLIAHNIFRVDATVENQGLGPAIIDGFSLYYNGKELNIDDQVQHNKNMLEFAEKYFGNDCHLRVSTGIRRPGSAIEAGKEVALLKLEIKKDDKKEINTKEAMNFIALCRVCIVYSSVYEDQYNLDSDTEGLGNS